MQTRITVDVIGRIRPAVVQAAQGYARRLPGLLHCDIRVEASEGVSAYAENGAAKASSQDRELSLGVRVLAGEGGAVAAGRGGGNIFFPRDVGAPSAFSEGVPEVIHRCRSYGAVHRSRSREGDPQRDGDAGNGAGG